MVMFEQTLIASHDGKTLAAVFPCSFLTGRRDQSPPIRPMTHRGAVVANVLLIFFDWLSVIRGDASSYSIGFDSGSTSN